MGWWTNADGDDLGDAPADEISRHLKPLATKLGAAPTLPALLFHLREVLVHKTTDLCEPGEDRPFDTLVADVDDGNGNVMPVPASGELVPQLRGAIDALCEAITDAYELELERRPTRRELLRTFSFVLRYAPDRFLDIDPAAFVTNIREAVD
jgi:hypothetical protein